MEQLFPVVSTYVNVNFCWFSDRVSAVIIKVRYSIFEFNRASLRKQLNISLYFTPEKVFLPFEHLESNVTSEVVQTIASFYFQSLLFTLQSHTSYKLSLSLFSSFKNLISTTRWVPFLDC